MVVKEPVLKARLDMSDLQELLGRTFMAGYRCAQNGVPVNVGLEEFNRLFSIACKEGK
jgi:hypothetical protein